MTTTPTTPTARLDTIHAHPANPRIDATADDEMVESIRQQGVLDPVMVALRPDGEWTLLDGHRRDNGARRAGLVEVPINPRYDLVTEAQQIEVMVITGLQKALLTPVEEAAGYEQLELLGMNAEMIAAATGFGVRRVKERLRLNALTPTVREKVHAGDASLVDIAALAEFADDPAATAELEDALGTDNFQHTVRTIRSRRERVARKAIMAAEFNELGAVRASSVPGTPGTVQLEDGEERRVSGMHTFPDDLRSPESHDGCLAYVMPDYEYSDPYLVCTDANRHPKPQPTERTPQPTVSDWEKQQAAREERRAARLAATNVRAEWIRTHLASLLPARGGKDLAAAAKAALPLLAINDHEGVDSTVLVAGLALAPADTSYPAMYAAQSSYAAQVARLSTTGALNGLAGYLAALITSQILFDDAEHIDDVTEVGYMLGVWDWLKLAGYPLSDYDKSERTALEIRHTELAAEAEDAAS